MHESQRLTHLYNSGRTGKASLKNKSKQQRGLQILHFDIIENMNIGKNKIIPFSEFTLISLHSPYIHHNTGKSSLRAD